MKLISLHFKQFRHIENQMVSFGNRLTVISGQNGTGKSSVLGWIAQLCDYKGKDKRLNGSAFKEDYRNVFRFCPENDYKNSYEVTFSFSDEKGDLNTKTMTTRHVQATDNSPERYRTDWDGRGNALDYPIIYLGLKRLVPLATEKSVTIKEQEFQQDHINTFSRLAKEILIMVEDHVNPEAVNSLNKDILAMKTDSYGHLGNSAGQDNIGQILSALLSFKKLKEELGNNYSGGLLLIDEIDASLYAGSQIKLIDLLFRYASILDIQVVFTTHSLEIISHLNEKVGEETKINHFILKNKKVACLLNPSFEYISNKIKNQVSPKEKLTLKPFVCEDKVAELWIKNLLNGSDLKKMIKVEKGPFPDGTIVSMAGSKHSIFKDVGFVLDGDVRKKFKDKEIPSRTVFLPSNLRPETLMYQFVLGLDDNDELWDDDSNFTKMTCFGNYQDSSKGTVKKWFEDSTNKRFFGAGYARLFNRWKKSNKELALNFQKELLKVV